MEAQKNKETRKGLREKALEINLDPDTYGTIAEIGAGQEVSRNFFQAGAASGTIAKTISAYDMIVSDTIYGKEKSGRYVCEDRVIKMLDREFDQLITRLEGERKTPTKFFAFADTVAMTSFGSDKPGHGWLGVRFQHEPKTKKYSQLILHVTLQDKSQSAQQYIIGALGVNMIHTCFSNIKDESSFIRGVTDYLDKTRLQVNMIRVAGPKFEDVDSRLLSLELVKQGYMEAAFFNPNGDVFQPSADLYKKHLLVLRGSFRPPTHVSLDMLNCGINEYIKRFNIKKNDLIPIAEVTMNNLTNWGDIDGKDFLGRLELLLSLGLRVMISNNERHYRLSTFFRRFTDKPVAMVLGYYNIKEIFDEKHYVDLEGGILQSFGVLFNHNDVLFCYPYREKGGDMLTSKDLRVSDNLVFLIEHLRKNDIIVDLKDVNKEILHIYSRRVLEMIQNGEDSWEEMVPKEVVETIKESCLFGYCEL